MSFIRKFALPPKSEDQTDPMISLSIKYDPIIRLGLELLEF